MVLQALGFQAGSGCAFEPQGASTEIKELIFRTQASLLGYEPVGAGGLAHTRASRALPRSLGLSPGLCFAVHQQAMFRQQ